MTCDVQRIHSRQAPMQTLAIIAVSLAAPPAAIAIGADILEKLMFIGRHRGQAMLTTRLKFNQTVFALHRRATRQTVDPISTNSSMHIVDPDKTLRCVARPWYGNSD